jgi:hypothetical protein
MPSISIIIATYNRPSVLRYAIESVLRSDIGDWELIIIGDGCSEETGHLVATFDDPRIIFENLPENSGGQAVPNNRGLALARGTYVCFLNQDDMFFPDHLSKSLAHIEELQADFIWSPVILFHKSGRAAGPPDPMLDEFQLDGVARSDSFEPDNFIIASSWFMTRAAADRVGPWHAESGSRVTPSQEWLFRASRSGIAMAFHPEPTLFCIHAGTRRLSYGKSVSPDHERAAGWIRGDADDRRELLQCVSLSQARKLRLQEHALHDLYAKQLSEISKFYDIHPVEAQRFFEGQASGEWIAHIKAFTDALTPLSPGKSLDFREGEGELLFGEGWHPAEKAGRWSCVATAELQFEILEETGCRELRLMARTLVSGDRVNFWLNGRLVQEHTFEDVEEVIIPLMEATGPAELRIGLDSVSRPSDISDSSDERPLGILLIQLDIH